MSITAYVIYDDLWDMYFDGQSFSSQLSNAKLFASDEQAHQARNEYCAGIKCEHYSISVHKLQVTTKSQAACLFMAAA